MIDRLVPAGVATAEAFTDPPGLEPMPAELSLIAKAVDKRRREFTTARHCARQAMAQLGIEPAPILRGERGAPVWPAGVVGSLTHCDGYRGAVVAYGLGVRSLGIDAEPHAPLPDGVLDHTSIAAERAVLATRAPGLHWDRLLFCAKEATYKAWFPLTNRWLGFEDAHITFTRTDAAGPAAADAGATGEFVSRILIDPKTDDGGEPLLELRGRWLIDGGLIMTSITVA
ncbi:4'-phosphopantetheinyl transferase superfamily protein [Gordonia sp. ABSL1-1]|uniref:4'-phosphopantetheinyl transferase family protein n=1 Tax=Gordonia sp. ABSL1-1 TaxID=3053923 RepID=UPI0025733E41|nr:4'-phosphopantetheinyl transferase superfamily protein [Gordonia sp. ABSL1-1]MDL9936307.1 4'-phosphopantetheinyl transferase superfamily protein [Gordonia sp. ABSL1-1]